MLKGLDRDKPLR